MDVPAPNITAPSAFTDHANVGITLDQYGLPVAEDEAARACSTQTLPRPA